MTHQKLNWKFPIKKINLSDCTCQNLNTVKDLKRDVLLVNQDTNAKLGLISQSFSVLSHEESLNLFIKAIKDLSRTDPRFINYSIQEDSILLKNNGAFAKIPVMIPNVTATIGNKTLNLQLQILNGLDGRTKLSSFITVKTKGFTLYLKEYNVQKFLHRSFSEPNKLKNSLLEQVKEFEIAVKEWKSYHSIKITHKQFSGLLCRVRNLSSKTGLISSNHFDRMERMLSDLKEENLNLFGFLCLGAAYTSKNHLFRGLNDSFKKTRIISELFYKVAQGFK